MPAWAQSALPRARIGYLVTSPIVDPPSIERRAFLDGLAQLGYVEGKNLTIEYRSAENAIEFLPDVARDLVNAKVDVIVAVGTSAALAARGVTQTLPIVMAASTDPIGSGLVESLARPGGNVTGLTSLAAGLAQKRIQLLHEVAPKVRDVAVLWYAPLVLEAVEMRAIAPQLGMTLHEYPVRDAAGFQKALEAMPRAGVQAVVASSDPLLWTYSRILARYCARHRIPAVGGWRQFAEVGGMMSYGTSFPALFRRAAAYVVRVLRGARPESIPIEQPTTFELIVNLKTAGDIGLRIPPAILLRADRVIE